MNIPSQVVSGDSASWSDKQFEDAQGRVFGSGEFELTYAIRGPSTLDILAVSNAAGWSTALTAAQSSELSEGDYSVFAVLKSGSERVTFGPVKLKVKPDPLKAAIGFDGRTVARRALEEAENALTKFKSSGGRIKKYKIGTREMEFVSTTEILELISYWRGRVTNEEAAEAAAKGLGNPRNLFVRF